MIFTKFSGLVGLWRGANGPNIFQMLLVIQVIVFLDCLHGDPIGFSVLGIFVIEKNTILTVRSRLQVKGRP